MIRLSSLPFFVFAMSASGAGDLYLLPERFTLAPGASCELGLHSGDFFPASEYAFDPERITRARWSNGTSIAGWRAEEVRTRADAKAPERAGSYIALLETVAERREMEADDFEAYLADEGALDTLEWRSRQGEGRKPGREMVRRYAKTLVTVGEPGSGVDRVAGHALEIVPLADPARLKAGEELALRVLYRGAPLRGLVVNARWVDAAGRMGSLAAAPTDARGRTSVKIEGAGRWKLHTLRLVRRLDRKEADWDTYSASLTFETGGTQ